MLKRTHEQLVTALEEKLAAVQAGIVQEAPQRQSQYPGRTLEQVVRVLSDEHVIYNERYEGRAGAPGMPLKQAEAVLAELKQVVEFRRSGWLSATEQAALDFLCLVTNVSR